MTEANESAHGTGPTDLILHRLDYHLEWYRSNSRSAERAYRRVKFGQIVIGASIPVLAAVAVPGYLTATVAAVAVAAEGAQQLFGWHANWIRYRVVAETLKRESFLYHAEAGPYTGVDRHTVLAERLDAVLAQENGAWVAENEPKPHKPRQS